MYLETLFIYYYNNSRFISNIFILNNSLSELYTHIFKNFRICNNINDTFMLFIDILHILCKLHLLVFSEFCEMHLSLLIDALSLFDECIEFSHQLNEVEALASSAQPLNKQKLGRILVSDESKHLRHQFVLVSVWSRFWPIKFDVILYSEEFIHHSLPIGKILSSLTHKLLWN